MALQRQVFRANVAKSSLRKMKTTMVGMAILALAAQASNAALVLYLDPNELSTMFGASGLGDPLEIGDTTRFITDVRSPTPGGNALDDWIDLEGNADSPVIVAHPTQGSVWSFDGVNDRMLVKSVDDTPAGGQQDGFGTAFNTNTLTTIVVGRNSSAGDGLDHAFDFFEDASVFEGFGIRYDHDNSQLNGFANQTGDTPVSLAADEWFVATYVWNGPASTATLTVQTASGISTATDNSASSDPLFNVSEMRLGRRTGGGDRGYWNGEMGDLLIYNDVEDHSDVARLLAVEYLVPEPAGMSIALLSVAGIFAWRKRS